MGGLVFVTARTGAAYGTTLYALALKTGQVRWSRPLGGTYYWSGIAYDGGRVFAVTYDGLLSSIDAGTGSLLWSAQLPGQYAFSSPPVATGGIVYNGGSGFGGTLYANRERTGKLVWTRPVANGDNSSPAVASRRVYVTYPDNYYAFNRLTGKRIWLYALGGDGGGGRTPVVADGHVYVRDWATSGRILSARSGALQGPLASTTAPAIADGVAYELVGSTLVAIGDDGLGTQRWSFTGDGSLDSAPIVLGKTVWVGSSSGHLYGVSVNGPRAGKWTTAVGASIPGPDEQNVSQPLTGFGASSSKLLVPAGSTLIAFRNRAR